MKQMITPMAGYCMEASLWQVMRDLCQQMLDSQPLKVKVSDVVLEDDRFRSVSVDLTDESTAVWYLGAMVAFMSSGHEVFGGRGIEYQTKHRRAKLPVLCKEHRNLTEVLHSCINADEKSRVTLSKLYDDACTGLERCLHQKRPIKSNEIASGNSYHADVNLWPEEME